MASQYSDVILAESSLQSYWKLDEASGNAADSKGAITGVAAGTLSYAQSGATRLGTSLGNSIKSNGSTPTAFDCGNNYAFSGTSSFTVEAWINRGTGGTLRLVSKSDESAGNGWLFAISSNKLYAYRSAGGSYDQIAGATTLSDNTWYHVAVTYDGTNLKLYLNGALENTAASSVNISSPTTNELSLFASSKNSATRYFYGGYMQHVAIYNTALSLATLKSHYTFLAAADSWAWSDSNTVSGGGGTTLNQTRYAQDSWAWSDAATRPSTPAARSAVGSPVTIFASNGVAGTFGAHYSAPVTLALQDGRMLATAQKASSHTSPDGVSVFRLSSDDGQTWGSEWSVTPYLVKIRQLASGRIAGLSFTAGVQTQYVYSDDFGATWSSPVTVTHGFYGTLAWPDDILELANGDLIASMYGKETSGATTYDVRVSKSTDGGATWTALSLVTGLIGGYSTVESQMELMNNGDIYLTFHTEDGIPTDIYRTRSQDSGATWTTPVVIVSGNSFNRNGLTHFANDGLLISANTYGDGITLNNGYYESYDGWEYGSNVTVATAPVAGGSLYNPIWTMCTALGGTGLSQNVGFTYSAENYTQDAASVRYRQFTGIDGTTVSRRGVFDSWAWSDTAAQTLTRGRTTADAWAWSDAAGKTQAFARTAGSYYAFGGTYIETWGWSDAPPVPPTFVSRTTSDTWAWSDTAVRSADPASRTTSDAWAWSDTAADTYAGPHYYSRTTSDTWAWSDSTGALGTALYWLRAARRRSMSAPTKTYTVVQAKGTTRTATWTSPTYESKTEAGILVALDVTAASGTGGLTLRINAHDLAGSTVIPLNTAPTAVTAIGTTSYALYPFGAISGAVTQSTSGYLPRQFSITVTAGDSSSYTYSVGYCLLP